MTKPKAAKKVEPGTKPRRAGPGRPQAEIDLAKLEALGEIQCTLDEASAVLGVGHATLERRLASDPAVAGAYERGKAKGRASLRRLQYQGAVAGNPTMLIWLGKQLLGQRDTLDVRADEPMPARVEVTVRDCRVSTPEQRGDE